MRIKLINASGAYVTEREELVYGECEFIGSTLLTDAPRRVKEEYVCDDSTPVIIYQYYYTEGQEGEPRRYITLYITEKVDFGKLEEAVRVLAKYVKEENIDPEDIDIVVEKTSEEIAKEQIEKLRQKLIGIANSLVS